MPVSVVTVGGAVFEVTTFTSQPAQGTVNTDGEIILLGAGYKGPGTESRAPITFSATIKGRRAEGNDAEDLRQWTVGFIQNVSFDRRAQYTRMSDNALRFWREMPKNAQDTMPLLDGSDKPWYKADGKKTFDAATGGQVTIATEDSPAFRVPACYPMKDPAYQLHQIDPAAHDSFRIWVAARKGDETPRKLALLTWSCHFDQPATREDTAAAACTDDQDWNLTGTPANEIEKKYTLSAS
jgi:hypothetical protein